MNIEKNRKTLVLYHAHCADGFGAAFAAWCALGDAADYHPVNYGEPWPVAIPDGSRVFIVDFSHPHNGRAREELCALAERCELLVIDHHATAQEALAGLPFALFDLTKSGAVLTWEYFAAHPELLEEDSWGMMREVPELLLYIQDRDLWRWELPQSREYSAGLSLIAREFDRWLAIIAPEGSRKKEIIASGTISLKRDSILVQNMCERAHRRMIYDGSSAFKILCVNAPVLQSDVCHYLLQQFPDFQVVAAYFDQSEEKRVWSLRSRKGFDCSGIAQFNGGGGHPQAAGFTEDLA